MKYIELGNTNIRATVDDEDYDRINQYRWYMTTAGYVVHTFKRNQKVKLHHFIIGRPIPPMAIDHINRNKWDNRKKNLRIVTVAQNNQNRRGFGVTWHEASRKWQVQCERNQQVFYLGLYERRRDAVLVAEEWRKNRP